MTAADLIERVRAAGGTIASTERGTIALQADAPLPAALMAELRAHKAAVIAELSQPVAQRTRGSKMCRQCGRVDRCFDDGGGFICPACAEWRVAGCPGFAVLATADTQAEMDFGACLRCGASWLAHGRPLPDRWHRYADLDDVIPAEVRFVLARARSIVRGTSGGSR